MKVRYLLLAILFLSISILAQSHKTKVISADRLINTVLKGHDYSGMTIFLTGYALSKTQQGLVNVGSLKTYKSSNYLNYISVWKVPLKIQEGEKIKFKVLIKNCKAYDLGESSTVLINCVYIE